MQMQILGFMAVGLLAGILSGLTGLGGGIIIVPALIYAFGYSAHMAQGTTLALMVPPIGILAAWEYYKNGNVNVQAAAIIAVCFIIGGFFGAKFSLSLSPVVLRKVLAVVLIAASLNMFFKKA